MLGQSLRRLRESPGLARRSARYERRKSHWHLVLRLIGQFASGATIFIALLAFEWIAAYAYHMMNLMYAFPADLGKLVPKLQVTWFWADIAMSGAVVFAGVARFIGDIVRGE